MSDILAPVEAAIAPEMFWVKLGAAIIGAAAISSAAWWVTATYFRLQIADMKQIQAQAVIIAQDEAAHKQAAADKITHDVDVANAEAHQKIQTVPLIQKVPVYVTPETDARFPLPCGFVRMHNAFADNIEAATLPPAADAADGAACPVTASAAAAIIGANYGLALGWQADLQAWDAWYAKQAANWNDKLKEPAPEKPSLLDRINPF